MKKVLFLSTLLLLFASCKQQAENNSEPSKIEVISVAELTSDDVLLMGTYDDLIVRMGQPVQVAEHPHQIIFDDDNNEHIRLEYPAALLCYEGISYVKKGDSVQLYSIDLEKTGAELKLIENGDSLILCSKTNFDEIYSRILCKDSILVAQGITEDDFMMPIDDLVMDSAGGYRCMMPTVEGFLSCFCGADYSFRSNKNLLRIDFGDFSRGGIFRLVKKDGNWIVE